MAADSGFAQLDRARLVRIETPEHVRLGFELAGIGSRFAAAFVDLAAMAALVVAISLALAGLGQLSASEWVRNLGAAGAALALFAVQWGYFFVAEGFFGGRTLGKRALGLRVIGAEGTPITREAAALRNLLRVVDVQPAGSCLIGLGLIALHARAQRLGDIVAGTVVVRDRGDAEIPEQRAAASELGRPRLDAQRFEVLGKYLERRGTLPARVRSSLRESVARAVGPLVGDPPTGEALDAALERLYEEERPRQHGATGASLQAVQLVRTQSPAWRRCRELVDRASARGLAALDEAELEEFTSLFREVSADLARAKTYGASLRLSFHLERLVSEAHNLFYRGAKRRLRIADWLRYDFPATFRRNGRYVAAAAIILFAPAFLVHAAVRDDVELGRRIVPPAMITRAEQARARMEAGEPYVDVPEVQMSVFSSRIMTNNVQVALLAAAGGALAGVGTVLILLFNGIHLGSVFALFGAHGAEAQLWVFVLPHGVLEMTAIVTSGAAGLLLGRALLAPGRRTRARALREDGRTSLALVGGAAALLVLAGLVEGFVSPARIPAELKVGFAASVAACLAAYLGLAGRKAPLRAARAP